MLEAVRVLIVEDSATARLLAVSLTRALGCEVHQAEDGAAALALLSGQAFNLVLMDLELPDMSGCDVSRKTRATQGPNRLTPIVAVSATDAESTRHEIRQAGMLTLMPKPLARPKLEVLLRQLRPSP
jgi:CheY-like chemotaxis protein